jgi:hypothetical protein
MGDNVVSGGEAFDWEAAGDKAALTREERAVRGRIDVIREKLVRALMGQGSCK